MPDAPVNSTQNSTYLYIAVFFSGLTSLAVEMAASRLLGNVFGTSNLVWASIIGLILIYLTLGYFIGGKWADRSPSFHTFYRILIWAALMIGIVPVISKPVLSLAANAFDQLQLGILFGSFLAVLILLIVPVTLLGTTSPFAIRLAVKDSREIGSISGRIYAISTLGSFIGTFVPVLLLIPLIGTYRTFVTFSGILLAVALIGLWRAAGWRATLPYLWMPLLVIGLFIWGVKGAEKATAGQVYETESAYNYIQVLEQNGIFMLRLNEGQGIHSVYSPTQLNFNGPWEQVSVGPFFNPAPYDPSQVMNMAIVGLAAGTSARQATAIYGPIPIDGFEIDPKIVEVGRKYFDMNEPNLNVIIQDGRWGLTHSTKRYQVISIDAYRPPYIPWHLTTKEFFEIVRQHLTEDGVVVMNVGRAPGDRRLINTLGSTLLTVFPSVHVMDIPNAFNSILYATIQPTQDSNLALNLDYLTRRGNVSPLLIDSMRLALTNLQPPPSPDTVFTDDLAPIEWITNNMVLKFLITENVEVLR
jgi:predicted membrane-bound spermidine synthase